MSKLTRRSKAVRTRRPGAGRKKTDAPKLPPLRLLNEVSIERQVYRSLRSALMSGKIVPGAKLTCRPISVALGVSATPVREALKRLEADGALIGRSKMAFIVNDPNQAEFTELINIRLSLETQAIRDAATRAVVKDLEPIRRIQDEYERLLKPSGAEMDKLLGVNFRFHFEIYKMSGSPLLVQLIETLWLRIGPALHRLVIPGMDAISADSHREMLRALVKRDPDRAAAALREDILAAAELLIPQLRP